MYYHEEKLDLLKAPREYHLAHCISADFALGRGVARQIQEAYDMRRHLVNEYGQWRGKKDIIGTCLACRDVLNLVTKQRYYEKPTLDTLQSALEDMRLYCVEQGIRKVAMPRIGCGLDLLKWEDVSPLIQEVFRFSHIEILVCLK